MHRVDFNGPAVYLGSLDFLTAGIDGYNSCEKRVEGNRIDTREVNQIRHVKDFRSAAGQHQGEPARRSSDPS